MGRLNWPRASSGSNGEFHFPPEQQTSQSERVCATQPVGSLRGAWLISMRGTWPTHLFTKANETLYTGLLVSFKGRGLRGWRLLSSASSCGFIRIVKGARPNSKGPTLSKQQRAPQCGLPAPGAVLKFETEIQNSLCFLLLLLVLLQ